MERVQKCSKVFRCNDQRTPLIQDTSSNCSCFLQRMIDIIIIISIIIIMIIISIIISIIIITIIHISMTNDETDTTMAPP